MIGDKTTGPGVMVLAMEDLFAAIESTALDSAYELSLSYLEVYNEQIRDLLAPEAHATAPVEGAPTPTPAPGGAAGTAAGGGGGARAKGGAPPGGLSLREDARNGIHVTGLSHHSPRTADEVLELLTLGNGNRAMSATHAHIPFFNDTATTEIYT